MAKVYSIDYYEKRHHYSITSILILAIALNNKLTFKLFNRTTLSETARLPNNGKKHLERETFVQ